MVVEVESTWQGMLAGSSAKLASEESEEAPRVQRDLKSKRRAGAENIMILVPATIVVFAALKGILAGTYRGKLEQEQNLLRRSRIEFNKNKAWCLSYHAFLHHAFVANLLKPNTRCASAKVDIAEPEAISLLQMMDLDRDGAVSVDDFMVRLKAYTYTHGLTLSFCRLSLGEAVLHVRLQHGLELKYPQLPRFLLHNRATFGAASHASRALVPNLSATSWR